MNIGKLVIENPIFLAPMAGVTDSPFRQICKEFFDGAVVSEMVSAKAVCYGDLKTHKLCEFDKSERVFGLQIFGSEPDIMAKAASELCEKYSPDFIDINMGCPAPKIVNNGEGSALMKNETLAGKIVYQVKKAIGDVPLTVKMRAGFDKSCINAPGLSRVCEQSGADAVFIHARTREQMYSPYANPDVIKQAVQSVKITVIGNGDVTDGKSAKALMDYTGCHGVMVGRATLGNPFVLSEIQSVLCGTEHKVSDNAEKAEIIKRHIKLLCEQKGEYIGVREARKHVAWYIKGKAGAAEMRNEVNTAQSLSEVISVIDKAFLA